MGRRWADDVMEVDEFEGGKISESSESEAEDEKDLEEVEAPKGLIFLVLESTCSQFCFQARYHYLKSL